MDKEKFIADLEVQIRHCEDIIHQNTGVIGYCKHLIQQAKEPVAEVVQPPVEPAKEGGTEQ